jgi:hypothetical protein
VILTCSLENSCKINCNTNDVLPTPVSPNNTNLYLTSMLMTMEDVGFHRVEEEKGRTQSQLGIRKEP